MSGALSSLPPRDNVVVRVLRHQYGQALQTLQQAVAARQHPATVADVLLGNLLVVRQLDSQVDPRRFLGRLYALMPAHIAGHDASRGHARDRHAQCCLSPQGSGQ